MSMKEDACPKGEKEILVPGRKFKLELKDRFLVHLVYYRLYITYTLSFLFDLDQSNVYRDIHMLDSLVKKCIPLEETVSHVKKSQNHGIG